MSTFSIFPPVVKSPYLVPPLERLACVSPGPEARDPGAPGATLFLVMQGDEIIDYGYRPGSLVEDTLATFTDLRGDLAVWAETDGEESRLVAYVRRDGDGKPKLTWL
jgi:hypothetical protein